MPSPGNKISRIDGGLAGSPTEASRRETAANLQGGSSVTSQQSCVSLPSLPVHRETECSLTSHSNDTLVLPCPTGQLMRSPGYGEPELQPGTAPWDRSPGGVDMVATSPD